MKSYSYFLLIFSLVCCGGQSKVVEDKKAEESTAKLIPTVAPKTETTTVSVDTDQEAAFPFDIKLKDVDGNIKSSAEVFKKNGKPTVLLFWLTTCGPCHSKLRAIKPLYADWLEQADFNAYAISGDFPKNYDKFVSITQSKKWPWETYNDVDRSFRNVLPGRLNGYPQTFIFDKDGKLVYQDKKYRYGDEKRLFEKIKEVCNS